MTNVVSAVAALALVGAVVALLIAVLRGTGIRKKVGALGGGGGRRR